MLIDTHAHLDFPEFANDLPALIERAAAQGVMRLITIGAGGGADSAQRAVVIAEKYPNIWCSVGRHPHDAQQAPDLAALRDLAQHPRCVAIGETGLDFYRDWAPVDMQRAWFRAQIELALSVSKPLIIHSRAAGPECLATLQELGAGAVGGVFHCFAEDAAFAASLREINFLVSFPGALTFKKAEQLRAVARAIPLDQIMLETDAPYMAPEPFRGRSCESAMLIETAKKLAEVHQQALEVVAESTTRNAVRLFRLPAAE
jgi:TatD DNase family protein